MFLSKKVGPLQIEIASYGRRNLGSFVDVRIGLFYQTFSKCLFFEIIFHCHCKDGEMSLDLHKTRILTLLKHDRYYKMFIKKC